MVRRTSLIVSEILAGLLAGSIALGGLAAWRLHSGPVPLDFLTPHLEKALRDSEAGFNIDIEKTDLVWAGWRQAIDIRVRNVGIISADGTALARVPQLSLGLSLRALVRGNIAPTSIDVVSPSIRVIRRETGEFALGFVEFGGAEDSGKFAGADPVAAEAGGMDAMRYVIGELRADPDPERPLSYLNRISVVDARIVFDDRLAGAYYRTPNAQIVAYKLPDGGIRAEASLELQYGERRAGISAEVGLDRDGQGITAEFAFHDVVPAGFVASLPRLAPLTALKMPLNGEVTINGQLGGMIDSIVFDVVGGAGKLVVTDFFREPLDIGGLRLRGSVTDNFQVVDIEQAVVALDGPTIYAKAWMAPEDGDTKFVISARTTDVSMAELDRFWPPSLAADPREWVTGHITNGTALEATIEVVARMKGGNPKAMALDSLGGKLVYSGLTIDYFTGLPPVRGISGQGTYDKDGFKLSADHGELPGQIKATGAKVDIYGFTTLKSGGKAMININVDVEGPVRATMDVLDRDPLNFGRKMGFKPEQLGGSVTANINFRLPLIHGLTTKMIEVKALADIKGASVTGAPLGLEIDNGRLKLDASQDEMRVTGKVRLNGVPTSLDWRENFTDKTSFVRRFDVTGRVDDAQRLALGLPDLSYWMKGPGEGVLTYTTYENRPDSLKVRADVAAAALELPEIDWLKAPGVKAKLEIDGTISKGRPLVLDRLWLKTGDLDARLRIEFLPDLSDVRRIDLQKVEYLGNDLNGTITLMENGGFDIDVNGMHIDARHWLGVATKPAEEGETKRGRPLSIKAKFEEVVTGEDRLMHNAGFNGKYDGRNWTVLIVNSTLGEGADFALNFQPDSKGYKLKIKSSDAGQALRSLDWWDEIQGGSLVVEARSKTVDGPLAGTFLVLDFKVKEAPVGLKLLQLITIIGLPAATEEGVSFAGMEGGFTFHKGFLRLGSVQAWGPVGVNVVERGWMDFNKGTLGLTGTVIPANTLQGLIGKIPLLGWIWGDGLLSANFTASGSLENPKVGTSKASIFAPLFLKKMFRVTPKTDEEKAAERKAREEAALDPNAVPEGRD